MFWFAKKKIHQLANSRTLDEQRMRARILVIDDDDQSFPTELLKAEGYNITHWPRVQNLTQLESGAFDIIILDIQGIASPEQSRTGGVGILKHIKEYNPAQIVVAYSGKKYDLNQGEFWKIADDFLGKPSPLIICKQKIDDLLTRKFSATYYWDVLRERLKHDDVPSRDIDKLEKLVVRRLSAKKSISKQDISETVKLSKETLSAASTIIGIIGKFISGT